MAVWWCAGRVLGVVAVVAGGVLLGLLLLFLWLVRVLRGAEERS